MIQQVRDITLRRATNKHCSPEKMKSVFVVQHLHRLPQDEDDVKMIGVYGTRSAAIASVNRLACQPGFCDFPKIIGHEKDEDDQGFHVDEYALGMDHWTEGFVTIPSE